MKKIKQFYFVIDYALQQKILEEQLKNEYYKEIEEELSKSDYKDDLQK